MSSFVSVVMIRNLPRCAHPHARSARRRLPLRMRNRGLGWIMVWLVLVGGAQLAALIAVWRFSVRTRHGQLMDPAALTGNTIGQDTVAPVVSRTLDAMSVASLAAATAVIVLIALV